MATKVILSFEFVEKQCGDQEVMGLIDMTVVPQKIGIGRKTLQMIEAVAESKIVVGFVKSDLLGFFEHCGWFIGGNFLDKTLVASEPIDDSKHSGEVW